MTVTTRLYYDDPALLVFDGVVMACEPDSGGRGHRVALDRSAFYPTSGGQPHDLGHLRVDGHVVAVSDVESDERDQVWHLVAEPIAVGQPVVGEIERGRRHDFRQQHTGQHILSAAFDYLLEARTESVHLGLEACTLDLHREVSADECRRAEDYANFVVFDNRLVTIRFADAATLASEPRLRKQTGRTGEIRLIDIEDHEIGGPAFDQRMGLSPVGSDQHFVSEPAQQRPQLGRRLAIVVHHQHGVHHDLGGDAGRFVGQAHAGELGRTVERPTSVGRLSN